MPLQIRSLSGESEQIEIEPSSTIRELKETIQVQMNIPIEEQRLVYAGKQLEEAVTEAWRRARSEGGGVLAVDAAALPLGSPLTLEHYAIQKHSVVNIVIRKNGNAVPASDTEPRPSPSTPGAPPLARQVTPPQGQAAPQGPTLEFMEPRSRNPAVPAGRGGGYNMSSADAELYSQLNGMSEAALLSVLGPLLESRPQLASVLLQGSANGRLRGVDPVEDTYVPNAATAASSRADAMQRQPTQQHQPQGDGFRRGDKVSVYSNSAQRWCHGEVINVCVSNGGKIPVGAVEVQFELGQKWISPQDIPNHVKAR